MYNPWGVQKWQRSYGILYLRVVAVIVDIRECSGCSTANICSSVLLGWLWLEGNLEAVHPESSVSVRFLTFHCVGRFVYVYTILYYTPL